MADWQEEYKKKIISAEEAANFIKSGDRVVFPMGRETFAIGLALAARLVSEIISLISLPSIVLTAITWFDRNKSKKCGGEMGQLPCCMASLHLPYFCGSNCYGNYSASRH